MKSLTYKIVKNAEGHRGIKLANGAVIPADIAGLAVGKDKWMSEVKCKCRDCEQEFPLRELHGGGQWCEECQCAGIEA